MKMRENYEANSSVTVERSGDNSEEKSSVGETPPFKAKWVRNWVLLGIAIHTGGLYGLCLLPKVHFLTIIWIILLTVMATLGTTMGAHRLYTHRAFKPNKWVEVLLVACYTMTGQRTLWTWVRDHRQHHKYSDTDADPHNSRRGFFFCHMGWLMVEQHPEAVRTKWTVDLSDVQRNKLLMFHKKYFNWLFLFLAVIFPTMVPYCLWNESLKNSLFVCFSFRFMLNLHFIGSINSFSHLFGSRPYNKSIQPRESLFVSVVTGGEGWHNFHHTFPWDYRAAQFGRSWNLTAAVIDFCAKRGWAHDLKVASPDLVEKYLANRGDGSHPFHQKFADHDQLN